MKLIFFIVLTLGLLLTLLQYSFYKYKIKKDKRNISNKLYVINEDNEYIYIKYFVN